MADPAIGILSEIDIVPVTEPKSELYKLNQEDLLRQAMNSNPAMQQARLCVDISDINIRVAGNQKMPRLDLIASASTQTLNRDFITSQLTQHRRTCLL